MFRGTGPEMWMPTNVDSTSSKVLFCIYCLSYNAELVLMEVVIFIEAVAVLMDVVYNTVNLPPIFQEPSFQTESDTHM